MNVFQNFIYFIEQSKKCDNIIVTAMLIVYNIYTLFKNYNQKVKSGYSYGEYKFKIYTEWSQ